MDFYDPLAGQGQGNTQNQASTSASYPAPAQDSSLEDLYTSFTQPTAYPDISAPQPAYVPPARPAASAQANGRSGVTGAGATFSSLGGATLDMGTPSHVAPAETSARASGPAIEVDVTDPQHEKEPSSVPGIDAGLQNKYVTYLITTRTSLPLFSTPEVQVRRRFSDFVALENLLLVTHRGYFIPPRPDKCVTVTNKLSTKFVDKRRHALQQYLRRLAAHRVIGRSEELRVFLEAHGDLRGSMVWQSLHPGVPTWVDGAKKLLFQVIGREKMVPAPAAAAQSTKASHDVIRQVKEYIHHVRHKDEAASLPEREVQLRQHSDMVRELAASVAAAARCATSMQRALHASVNELGELGLAIGQLGHYEEANMYTLMGQSQKGLGQGCLMLNTLGLKAVSVLGAHTRVLDEQNRMMTGVLEALNSREEALTTLQWLEEDINIKRARANALQAAGKMPQVHKVMQEVAAAEAARQAALAEYERVAERNLEELNQFVDRQSREVAAALVQWAHLHEQYAKKQYDMWLQIAKELGADSISVAQIERNVQ